VKRRHKIALPYSWPGRINIIKMSVLPTVICQFKAIPIKIPRTVFTEVEKMILTFKWDQRPQMATITLSKKNKADEEERNVIIRW
jgi:hypothetical protein